MEYRILNPSESEPVATQQVIEQIAESVSEIEAALLKQAGIRQFSEQEVHETLDYLKSKADLLIEGLIPEEDHAFLSGIIDYWFSNAMTSTKYANEMEQSDRVIRAAIDGIHVVMASNQMIKEDTQAKILERWPPQEPPETSK